MSDDYQDAAWDRRYASVLLVDGKEVACFRRCCHCQAHVMCIKGSGKKRGHCWRCNDFTCGAPGCDVCIPFEQWLDILEGRYTTASIPIVASVPRSIGG